MMWLKDYLCSLNHKKGIFYFGSDVELTVNEVVAKD